MKYIRVQALNGNKLDLTKVYKGLTADGIRNVWTIYDENLLKENNRFNPMTGKPIKSLDEYVLENRKGVFFEEKLHDWYTRKNDLIIQSRTAEINKPITLLLELKNPESMLICTQIPELSRVLSRRDISVKNGVGKSGRYLERLEQRFQKGDLTNLGYVRYESASGRLYIKEYNSIYTIYVGAGYAYIEDKATCTYLRVFDFITGGETLTTALTAVSNLPGPLHEVVRPLLDTFDLRIKF